MAGPLGVSHLLVFNQTDAGINLRIARAPRGPTVTFRVNKFAGIRDVMKAERRPRAPGKEFGTPPLVSRKEGSKRKREGDGKDLEGRKMDCAPLLWMRFWHSKLTDEETKTSSIAQCFTSRREEIDNLFVLLLQFFFYLSKSFSSSHLTISLLLPPALHFLTHSLSSFSTISDQRRSTSSSWSLSFRTFSLPFTFKLWVSWNQEGRFLLFIYLSSFQRRSMSSNLTFTLGPSPFSFPFFLDASLSSPSNRFIKLQFSNQNHRLASLHHLSKTSRNLKISP